MKNYLPPEINCVDLTVSERVASTICEKEGILWVKNNGVWIAFTIDSPALNAEQTDTLPGCVMSVYADGLKIDPPS